MLTKIDDLILPDHWYLESEDECYFLGEYTAGKGFAYSATNQRIFNLKKGMQFFADGKEHSVRRPNTLFP